MARYREKRPLEEIVAILYTGDNVEEIKEFLGKNFIKIDEQKRIWYRPYLNSTSVSLLMPNHDVACRNERGRFYDEYKDTFLMYWEEVE